MFDIEEKYHKRLCLQIYEKANSQVVTETIDQFTWKLKDSFDQLILDNNTASKTYNYSELKNLSKIVQLP